MNDTLPQPSKTRWQPLRLGLIELYHYDVEEFWFDVGHLMLRGNNGTGKSKVLSLTLPFLLDASLSSARIEPDADPKKRMDWNLLMGGKFDRRTGYAWLEFGRVDADGAARFVTLGAGLRATAGRPHVDSWFFLTEQRVGEDLALVDDNNAVATRDRLSEALGGRGLYTTARDYRRAVDERLFALGSERYRALIDTLIQLRQPQLSKQPNENNLSRALSQALAPLDRSVLEDVAEAMNQLDEYRSELEDHESMLGAVERFNATHIRYAQIFARRRARALRQAQTAVDNASAAAREARANHAAAEAALQTSQQQVETTETRQSEVGGQIEVLRDSPEMRSANELHRAQTEAEAAERAAGNAQDDANKARQRHAQEQTGLEGRRAASQATRDGLAAAMQGSAEQAAAVGVAELHRASWGEASEPDEWAGLATEARRELIESQQRIAATRSGQIDQIRRGLAAVDRAHEAQLAAQHERDARQADSEAAEADLGDAHRARQDAAKAHIADWYDFAAQAGETLGAAALRDWPDADEALADWVHSLAGLSPLDAHWNTLAEAEHARLAATESDLRQQQKGIEEERAPLLEEQQRLRAGRESPPPAPYTREADRTDRPGAPLWQLIDFAPEVEETTRAAIEAALQASGVLDAWVTPEGALLDSNTHDTWLVARHPQPRNLGALLRFDQSAGGAAAPVAARHVEAILAAVALVDHGDASPAADAEYWVATDGRYRLGPVQGAWHKPVAEYIGFAARQAARERRLEAIASELETLAQREREIEAAQAALAEQREAFKQLQGRRPNSDALRSAHATQAASERRAAAVRSQLAEAEERLQTARQALERAHDSLTFDAQDAALPAEREALEAVARSLGEYRLAIQACASALREHAQALAELTGQAEREAAARADLETSVERSRELQQRAQSARARHEELARSVGATAEEVLNRLNALIRERDQLDAALKTAQGELVAANKKLGAAEQAASDTAQKQEEEQTRRSDAVADFQAFAATGLLRAAAPHVTIPDTLETWTNDAALTAARGAETALASVDDSDAAWQRAQNRLGSEFAELQRALSARGFDSFGEPGEHGFVVRITFNQRAEAPDALQGILEREIAERRRLLTARETEIIENHLQAEIAAQLQGLMRAADARVNAINAELDKRPTSTGVKFKLVWEPVPDEDGSLARLGEVRKLLLNKISDAWSPADRNAVGEFLQQRINAERERDVSAARIDQLATALDYRAWHRFRVRRWQDGQWKPLSGPASSGERALGLTVPLFAAAASHYESAADFSPRLVLLDEAFAGIDDGARAHCMDLIREFDLDFVMTSEREWACYAELPGVSICHLVRRADIDAVFVSRWRWNGRVRERAEEPARLMADVGT
jgi:uncharacterized protein (TIGR02680 family)